MTETVAGIFQNTSSALSEEPLAKRHRWASSDEEISNILKEV